jgi:pullulanase
MKYIKALGILAVLAITAPVIGCGKKADNSNDSISSETSEGGSSSSSETKPSEPIENDSGLPELTSYLDEPGFQIHYQRYKGSYLPWCLWLWGENAGGAEYTFNYSDDYGVIAYYPLSAFKNSANIGFIVKESFAYAGAGVWNKDVGEDRFLDLDLVAKDEHDIYHIYLRNDDKGIYSNSDRSKTVDHINSCQFNDNTHFEVSGNNPIKEIVVGKNGEEITISKVTKSNNNKKYTFELDEAADVSDAFNVFVTFESDRSCHKYVSIRKLYNSAFDTKYNYDGELGAIYTNTSTEFKVWSPVSSSIELRIYENGTPTSVDSVKGNDEYTPYVMNKGSDGVFTKTLSGDLEGKYYTYFVKNGNNPAGAEIVDPYARGAGVNGLRGMVVDFSKTDPAGWETMEPLTYDRKQLTVYETHIAELTCSETWNGTVANAKKYAGFYESGTSYKGVSTGFDHIKELGVNAVQIIPIFDQANDEINTEFNWGYNPLNYNVVEGAYSSNPYDGYVRINELKSLIKAYHDVGIEIIMDVVYNHVNGLVGSNFDVLMPGYYFRYNNDGSASTGSGCGNDTASERYMYKKFMVDSVAFWTEEYKFGGFRFDLMGLHGIDVMNEATAKAKTINPYINIWGEPWAMGTASPSGYVLATQANGDKYVGYGQFNDKMRDALIAGGMSSIGDKGWINQMNHSLPMDDIVNGLQGKTGTSGKLFDPDKTVNYVTCHDNWTLNDRFLESKLPYDHDLYVKMNVLANALVFTSQGTSFMLAGEEMLRTKVVYNEDGTPKEAMDEDGNPLGRPEVSGNSYNASYKTNQIDYQWKVDHPEMMANYKKLIEFKQITKGLHYGKEHFNSVELLDGKGVIHISFNDGVHQYDIYHANGIATEIVEINTQGYTMYLDTLGNTFNDTKMTIHKFESIILYK